MLSQDLSPLFFNGLQSLERSQLAGTWQMSQLKGKKEDPSNYRPVSLTAGTAVPIEVMENVILGEAEKHLRGSEIIGQHGFMSGKSC